MPQTSRTSESAPALQRRVPIFAAGRHVSLSGEAFEFGETELREIAAGYDPKLSEAPHVVGHPKTDAPAYGWVTGLAVENGTLFAESDQVEPQFAELVSDGRFKKRSAAFYAPEHPSNPTPGRWYLRHVGWLGAQPPAVKGLQDVQFAEGDDALVTIEFSEPARWWVFQSVASLFGRLRDWMIERDGLEAADRVLSDWQIQHVREAGTPPASAQPAFAEPPAGGNTPEDEMPDRTAEFAERETALNTRDADLKAREKAIRDRELAARREDVVAFADELVDGGQLLPRERPGVVEVLMTLDAAQPVSFAEGDAQVERAPAELLREVLKALPKRVDFSEKSSAAGTVANVEFAAPAGVQVDASRTEVYSRAKAYQAAHPNTEFLAAVRAVGG